MPFCVKLLYNVINSLSDLEQDEVYDVILKDKLKNTNYKNKRLDNAIRIKDLKKSSFKDDEYVFLLGFNLNSLPNTIKDIDYLNDKEKEEVDLYTTVEMNTKERKLIPYLISNIHNLTITYKTSSPFQEYFPSYQVPTFERALVMTFLHRIMTRNRSVAMAEA